MAPRSAHSWDGGRIAAGGSSRCGRGCRLDRRLASDPVRRRPRAADRARAAASVVYNCFWVPGGALLTEAAESHGLERGFSFALFNFAWAPAGAVGAIAGGSLADLLGNGGSYLVLAVPSAA